jgi:hypothetical protein
VKIYQPAAFWSLSPQNFSLPRAANYRILALGADPWGTKSATKSERPQAEQLKNSRTKKKKFATANEIRRLGGEIGVQF